jgi:hypothetical protein
LESDDVDFERDGDIVMFVRVGDVFDESDCGAVEELDIVVDVGEVDGDEDVEIGVFDEREKGISKISTISRGPFESCPPPKNILFVDDVDASQ